MAGRYPRPCENTMIYLFFSTRGLGLGPSQGRPTPEGLRARCGSGSQSAINPDLPRLPRGRHLPAWLHLCPRAQHRVPLLGGVMREGYWGPRDLAASTRWDREVWELVPRQPLLGFCPEVGGRALAGSWVLCKPAGLSSAVESSVTLV